MSLVPRFVYGDLDLTDWPFAVEFGGDLGAPQNVSELVESLLQDGEVMSTRRRSNREITLAVLIEDADMIALAEAEASLVAEADKAFNTLSVDPGDGLGAVTVFETFTAQVQFVRDDDFEQNGVRRYVLSIPALPFGRSDTLVSVDGVAAGAGSTVVLSDGSATTGWSVVAPSGGVFASAGGVLSTPMPNYPNDMIVRYTAAAAVDMSTTPYIEVDIDAAGVIGLRAIADGVDLRRIGSRELTSGFTRVTFLRSTSWTTLDLWTLHSTGQDGTDLRIDQLRKTATPPMVGSTRQKFMSLPILGSARSPGSLAVEHETDALGDTIIYTYPEDGRGFVPALRYWRTAGTVETTDAAMVSGKRSLDMTCTIPLTTLRPGPYLVVARGKQTAAGAGQTVTAGFAFDGQAAGVYEDEIERGGFSETEWRIVRIGVASVPDHDDDTTITAKVRISSGGQIEVDEAWLFYIGDDAHLTQLALGSTAPDPYGASNRVWIDTPSTARPYPSIWRGTQADRSDALSAASALEEFGAHQFTPPGMVVLTVTTNALDAVTSFEHYPRFHSNAQRVD